jgi:CRISPR-associated Csx2 family protein
MTYAQNVLLTSLSPTPRKAEYSLNKKTAAANQSPIALLQLLPRTDLPNKIMVLCTKEIINTKQFALAKKDMLEELKKRDIHIKENAITDINIPDGKNPHELWEILRTILDNIPQGVNLTLDITHGFRSFPFVFFTAAIFLQALRDVKIRAVYYGMLTEGRGPMVDLSLILDMVEWFYATRIFKETGQAYHINELLVKLEEPPEGSQDYDRAPYNIIKPLRESLHNFTNCYTQALPLELGLVSAQAMHELSRAEFTEAMHRRIQVPDELIKIVKDFIKPFALSSLRKKDKRRKEKITLDLDEMKRQARIIDTYLNQGYLNYAVGIMREWMISVVLMHSTVASDAVDAAKASWLVYGRDREPVETQLNYLANIIESSNNSEYEKLLSVEQKWLGSVWKDLRKKRNHLAHHGYREDYLLQREKHVEKLEGIWEELKKKIDNCSWWQPELKKKSVHGTLLVSPLGLSKGLLFSALKHTKPSRAVVITSKQSVVCIQEIINEAGWEGEITIKTMKEPFTGFDETERLVREIQPMLWDSEDIIVNITGGTTAMQYIVQQVADYAAKKQLSLKVAALIDRRPPAEQNINPYIPGEIAWLKNKDNSN